MRDPFFAPPPAVIKAVQPFADELSLKTLPFHSHEIAFAFFLYSFLDEVVAPLLSTLLFPSVYPRLSRRTQINWNVHAVSLVQSILVLYLAFWVIFSDVERGTQGWKGRIWGYTGAQGMVQGFAAGYFLWDVVVSTMHLNILGVGSLAHAVSALIVTCLGFRPFANYYGMNFILYELSTPFLNIHWFLDKFGMTGSRIQFYNGMVLLATFGSSRLLWGTYQSIQIYQDVWKALQASPGSIDTNITKSGTSAAAQFLPASGEQSVPTWLAWTYLGSNTLLSFLNFYWFWLMIGTVMKRFRPVEGDKKAKKDT
ncbi:MAG: hypothetical protein M1825_000918 [Sarcosagium campestre]|nr:MAG: hypothetical protein M1825_000918 [Sarcosagium campestre]